MCYKTTTWIFCIYFALPSAVEMTVVDENNTLCEVHSNILSCDLLNLGTNEASLRSVSETIKSVYVHNGKRLEVHETICASMTFQHISEIHIKQGVIAKCKNDYELSAWKSSFGAIPRQLTKIYLKDCSLSSLSTDESLTSLNVFNSNIDVLNISQPLGANVTMKFEGSKIGSLIKVILNHGSQLILHNSSIGEIASNGLTAQGGYISIKNSSILKINEGSINIHAITILDLENISGSLKLSSFTYSKEETRLSDPESSDYFGAFIVCLTIILLAIIGYGGFILYKKVLKQRIEKYKRGKTNGCESDKSSEIIEGDPLLTNENQRESDKKELNTKVVESENTEKKNQASESPYSASFHLGTNVNTPVNNREKGVTPEAREDQQVISTPEKPIFVAKETCSGITQESEKISTTEEQVKSEEANESLGYHGIGIEEEQLKDINCDKESVEDLEQNHFTETETNYSNTAQLPFTGLGTETEISAHEDEQNISGESCRPVSCLVKEAEEIIVPGAVTSKKQIFSQ